MCTGGEIGLIFASLMATGAQLYQQERMESRAEEEAKRAEQEYKLMMDEQRARTESYQARMEQLAQQTFEMPEMPAIEIQMPEAPQVAPEEAPPEISAKEQTKKTLRRIQAKRGRSTLQPSSLGYDQLSAPIMRRTLGGE